MLWIVTAFSTKLPDPAADGLWRDSWLHWLLPALIGLLIAAALTVDSLWAHSLSLQWAAPLLRDITPPVLMILAAILLATVLLAVTIVRHRFPPREYWPITLLLVPTQLVGFSLGNLEPLKICLLLTTGIWLIDALGNNRTVRAYPPFLMMWLVILAFSFCSVMNGLVTSLLSQYSMVAKFLMFFMVANTIRTREHLLYAVRLAVALGIMSAALALMQEALFYFFKLAWSLDPNEGKYWFKETPLGWMIRATGFHPTAQNLSHYLLIALALLLLGPFPVRQRIAGGLLMIAAVFFTFSGNALLAAAFILFLAPIVYKPRLSLHYVCAVSLIVLIAYQTGLLEIVYQKYFVPISDKSTEDRVELLQMGLEVIGRHPLFGVGLNNFGRWSPQPVHNAYMQLITEIGLIPGALLLLMLATIAARLLTGLLVLPPGPLKQCVKGILLAFIGLCFHFMFEPFINSLVSWWIIGLAEAAALLVYGAAAKAGRPFPSGDPPPLPEPTP